MKLLAGTGCGTAVMCDLCNTIHPTSNLHVYNTWKSVKVDVTEYDFCPECARIVERARRFRIVDFVADKRLEVERKSLCHEHNEMFCHECYGMGIYNF